MKYIIYGANRVAKDFLYIFDDLDILYLVDDICILETFAGYPVIKTENALTDTSYDKVIICDFDKSNKEKRLQKCGLVYGKDYVYEEDFFEQLNNISIPNNRKIAVWGTGNKCHILMQQNFKWTVEAFIDTNKIKDTFMGKPLFSPDDISDWKQYYIIIAVVKDREIREKLFSCNLKENEDFVSYRKLLGMPSHMLRQTIFDRSFYDLECNTMLNHLEILRDGNTRCCCTTFVKEDLDNIFEKNIEELWHSKLHKIMCLSTENKTFSFCDKDMCPLFVAKKQEKHKINSIPYKNMKQFPEVLALGYDSSCNLFCSTCRKDLCFAKDKELELVNKITDKVKAEYLENCKFLIMAGAGEVFFSPRYRSVYESDICNPPYIRLLSNGMLFNHKNWESFIKKKTGKILLTVSIDAATKKTYEHIRRGGNFEILKKNMEFASELHKRGELSYFRMNFVVQRENYKEMIPFVEWGKELGVNEIFFTKILNWGTYTSEEFTKVSMMEEDGITPKPELKEILEHPVMKSDIVDLGTIQYLHKIDKIDIVENYYMWELEKRGGKLF